MNKGTIIRPLTPRLWELLEWQKSQHKNSLIDKECLKKARGIRHGGRIDRNILTLSEWDAFLSWQIACSDQQGNDCVGCGLKDECNELFDWMSFLNRNFLVGPVIDTVSPSKGNPCVENVGFSLPLSPVSILDCCGAPGLGTGERRGRKL